MKHRGKALTYRTILLVVSTVILLLDMVLAILIYRHYISPSYRENLRARMYSAYQQVAQAPTGDMSSLLRENIHVLVVDEDGRQIYSSVQTQEKDLEQLRRSVDRASTLPIIQSTESDTKGELSLIGRSGTYYIRVSTQLDPIFSVATDFMRYSVATGVVVWLATLVLVVLIERQLFQPITEAVQVAKRIARQDFSQRCGTGGIARQSRALAESLNEMSDQLQTVLEQLRQANQQLQADIQTIERSESAMKNLIGNLSHDLKTPLALISGYAEGLSVGMAKTPAQQQEYSAIILDETERMRQIITRMLQLSQLESGQVHLELERFNVSELLEHTLNQFSMEMDKLRITLQCDYSPELWTCTDYIACDQVLTNLIQNAVFHATPPHQLYIRAFFTDEEPVLLKTVPIRQAGGNTKKSHRPTRWVGTAWNHFRGRTPETIPQEKPTVLQTPQRHIRIEIFNSSPPISPTQMEHLFDRFYRGEQSRRRSNGEMGLGLAIVRGNMELLQLPYGVRNEDKGVVFWIELPAESVQKHNE